MNASLAARSTFSKTGSIRQAAQYRTCLFTVHSRIAWIQTTRGLNIFDVARPSCKHLIKLNRDCHIRASIDGKELSQLTDSTKKEGDAIQKDAERPGTENGAACKEEFPSGDMDFEKFGVWDNFVMRLKMLCTVPWQRVKKGSVLKLKISGKITEQFQGRFTPVLSLPQICQNLIKAAYDPRISGVYLQIEPLDCGWGKIEEIRRHILFYKKSGKFIIGYMTVGGEKEYYIARTCQELYVPPGAYVTLYGLKVQATFLGGVLEKVGVEPEVERIGKYKSAGDLISRKDMSEENREMLTALLDDIYSNWLGEVSSLNGKNKEDVESLLNAGVFEIEKLKEGGWITDIKYDDEVEKLLKERLNIKEDKNLPVVDNKKYSRVKLWTLNLAGSKDQIAVLRAVGSISRTKGGINVGGEGIVSDQFIDQIRQVRDAKNFKAVVLRIDSPGGDALASDLMWRELRLLAAKKPLIASMVDVAASGGYYMAMAANTIVSEKLTLTGSIGVVTGRFSLKNLYEKVGYTKEVISRGKFAELDAEQRPLRPEEKEFFAKSAQEAYRKFRDKAALSRSMEIEKMEEVAQGRVWTGKAASDRGLVDTLGGMSKAVAIAKQRAGIPQDTKVSLIELSKRPVSVTDVLRSGVTVVTSLSKLLSTGGRFEVLQELAQHRALLDDMYTYELVKVLHQGLALLPTLYRFGFWAVQCKFKEKGKSLDSPGKVGW
ncbi:hypothetical protein GOP47_0021891 [Adiantum capillus-veneris]|uniref:Peptidase S49 domain-containing protein n=1 Tax=Adiantum capillus-veneris TaxID=13818 RepID=A0A9D4UA19_ADICA|nr:hypothetical protein GOP47_0021891 [Adiantum capillus-veneris]